MKLQSIAGTISRRTWFLILGVVIALALVVHGIWPLSNRSTSHDEISVDLGHIADAGAAQDAGVIGSPEAGAPGVTWQVPELWIQNDITSTSSGPVIFTGNRKRDNYSDIRKFWLENAVVSLDPDNGSVRWYRLIKPGREYKRTEYERELTRRADISTSPDGRYMALRLAPVWEEEPSVGSPPWDNSDATIGKKSQTIVVLSAESGEVVRTMQTDHNVLAQALTNNALIVETSPFSHLDEGTISSYYLDGGTISSYSLDAPEAPPSSWPATGWLVSSTADSVVLSPRNDNSYCQETCATVTLTLADPATGQSRSTVDRIYRVTPYGWAERFIDAASTTINPKDVQQWQKTPRELVDLGSDARANITGLAVKNQLTPTGSIRLLTTLTTKATPAGTPVSWLPGTQDPDQPLTPRTDPVEIIEITSGSCSGKDCVQRTTLTLGTS